jgi:hypothetical protein
MVAGWGLASAIANHWEAGGSWARAAGWLCARAWGGAFSGSAARVGQQPAAAGGGLAGPGRWRMEVRRGSQRLEKRRGERDKELTLNLLVFY